MMAEAANVESINAPFPGSILFYSAGAIVIESIYRLILLTLPLWLIANLVLRKRGQLAVFWVVALLTSLIETSEQMGFVSANTGLAPLVFRVSFYLVWHVVGGVIGF